MLGTDGEARPRPRGDIWVVLALAAGAAAAACFAGCHPTGTPVLDPLYSALFAAIVTLAAGWAARGTLLWLGVLATAVSRGVLLVPASASLVVAFAGSFWRRPDRRVGALVGALAAEVVLRWRPVGFLGATALLAAAAVAPCLVSGARALSPGARRWLGWGTFAAVALAALFTIPAVIGGLAARTEINRGITASEGALGSVSAGDAAAGTQQLVTARSDFSAAARSLGAWWTGGARLVPVVAQQRQAMAGAVEVARDVATVAATEANRID
ncbi:MAG TPA: hypothetical protein VGL49_08950, partial [Acidimicrobiales bacterium]